LAEQKYFYFCSANLLWENVKVQISLIFWVWVGAGAALPKTLKLDFQNSPVEQGKGKSVQKMSKI
jgi:hypothetical protein